MKKAKKILTDWRICIPFGFLYLETVFHFYMKLSMKYAPIFLLFAFVSGVFCTGLLFFLSDRDAKIAGFILNTVGH